MNSFSTGIFRESQPKKCLPLFFCLLLPRRMYLRTSSALCILIFLLRLYNHLSAEVAIYAYTTLHCWLCLWVGAWLQFMWGKEGLLK